MSLNLIKLDATSSTNDYLKQLCQVVDLPDFTVVTSKHQTKGRGQHQAIWISDLGKNLLCSVLVRHKPHQRQSFFHFNMMVSLAVYATLHSYKIPNLAIKWPNDILSDSKKISGILIENSFKSDKEVHSIIGVGINVNQLDMEPLENRAISMAIIQENEFDVDEVMFMFVNQLKLFYTLYASGCFEEISFDYHQKLFKKGERTLFSSNAGEVFEGEISHVNAEGRLVISTDNLGQRDFGIKEISFLDY
jgi:BirA family transcriptional regulator, biotin operon repressor / biotin---[acetyl-CoA-carboxylase] ligase